MIHETLEKRDKEMRRDREMRRGTQVDGMGREREGEEKPMKLLIQW